MAYNFSTWIREYLHCRLTSYKRKSKVRIDMLPMRGVKRFGAGVVNKGNLTASNAHTYSS
jgi:hypothetical protein